MNLRASIVLVLLVPQLSLAIDIEAYTAKLRKVVEQDGRCQFAVLSMPGVRLRHLLDSMAPPIMCVGDIYLNKGTINERQGCAAFQFDAMNLTTKPIRPEFEKFNIAENQSCEAGGLEAVMNDTLYTDYSVGLNKPGIKVPVSSAFIHPYGAKGWFDLVLLYSEHSKMSNFFGNKSKYEIWFENARNTEITLKRVKLPKD
jgi:hypothetical protein